MRPSPIAYIVLAVLMTLVSVGVCAQGVDPLAESRALAQNAEASQSLGKFQLAVDQLQQALTLAEQTPDSAWQAVLYGQLGGAYLSLQQLDESEQSLQTGLKLAASLQDPALEASLQNNLGHVRLRQGKFPEALAYFETAAGLAEQAGHHSLQAKAALSAAETGVQSGAAAKESIIWLDRAWQSTQRLPLSRARAYLEIRNTQVLRELAGDSSGQGSSLLATAAERLQQAIRTADASGDPRAASFAYGYLGELYEQEGRYADALKLTDTAVFRAQQVYAPELRYRWEWQQGRIYRALGNNTAAIDAYRRASKTLQSIREEFTASNETIAASFREDASPLFLGLADLLLRESEASTDVAQTQALLKEARETIELLKTTEVQDYFQDDCVAAVRARVKELDDTIAEGTALLYPISLPDRLELLVSLPSGLVKYTVPVTNEALVKEVRLFRKRLEKRTTRQYMRQALQLYQWLIKPIDAVLQENGVTTLVVVPDSALRAVPIAALHDGKNFLITRYAVAMTPSLRLTDPRPIKRENISVLLNGLTESVQGFPPLVFVGSELDSIQNLYGGKVFQDAAYQKSVVKQELADNQYSIVHFATHGQFVGKVKDSFILTYDGKISMDDLEEYVGVSMFREDNPVELLTLSACETAAGDDTAALGLASVAIKAGARSALASLWSINDEASSELVSLFYKQLQDPDVSKAEALQLAQISFLEDLRYKHPSYWAPFLLIGNWL
jgi:CHAT domain-containing protein/predicted negative regulator of RcsB-dependent stress response